MASNCPCFLRGYSSSTDNQSLINFNVHLYAGTRALGPPVFLPLIENPQWSELCNDSSKDLELVSKA